MQKVILAAGLAMLAASAFAQQAKQNYAGDYTGEWAVNGSCERGSTFVFARTWIERAGEDICYIDHVDSREQDVVVKATCWHEGVKVGAPTYKLRQRNHQLELDGRPPVRLCGGVRQELIEVYGPPIIGPRP